MHTNLRKYKSIKTLFHQNYAYNLKINEVSKFFHQQNFFKKLLILTRLLMINEYAGIKHKYVYFDCFFYLIYVTTWSNYSNTKKEKNNKELFKKFVE